MAKSKMSDFIDIAVLFLVISLVLTFFFYAIIKYG
ncbi:hypothetical protein PQB86_gp077 [Klebsiella phage Miami]|uniref:Uncharacterized protein n=1 Tax=Klebsiella phage Miami TaxID=2767581 RepID=A0A873WJH0_9CAUD|nr:hypothetical protein PQB86_gp077 [Klebsiella phage Miami]QPB09172.1 hypothetical protein CPT_Miami_077 [Klebsiella phage Miami]WPH68618.1 hypothetical protein [Stenotrophomonas phage BUCTxx100]